MSAFRSEQSFDVIIIGGRNAGASLALRLSRHDLKVLLVDRATFPSLPSVPSSPIIHPGTMRLLDELGIAESEYTLPGGKIEHYVMEFVNYFQAAIPTRLMQLDRNYTFGIDRNRFDTVLWEKAAAAPGVTARANFSVTRVLRDDQGCVNGMIGKTPGGEEETFYAGLVIGADGRFSFAAREFGAEVVEEENDQITASFHAEWENVDPISSDYPQAVGMYIVVNDFAALAIPISDRKYIIGTYQRADDANLGTRSREIAYEELIQKIPALAKRLEKATRVTDVVGVKRIANGYREAYGDGWALVGDALHYKDPIDGQGIYDALLGTRYLAEAIVSWKQGADWSTVAARYRDQIVGETHPMFLQTVARMKQQMYKPVPAPIVKTYLRWMMTDPVYQAQFVRYIARAIDPAEFNASGSISPAIIFRGIMRDLRPAQTRRISTANTSSDMKPSVKRA